jgi:hypothetical protein
MPTLTSDSKLTKRNYIAAIRLALRHLEDVKVEDVVQAPWKCPRCECAFARFNQAGENIGCVNCGAVSGLGPVKLTSKWTHVTVRHQDNVVLVAIVGPRLLIATSSLELQFGKTTVGDFIDRVQEAVFVGLGMRRGQGGIWRRPDGTRLDGYDAADLVFGFTDGTFSAEEIAAFAGAPPVELPQPSDSDASADLVHSELAGEQT